MSRKSCVDESSSDIPDELQQAIGIHLWLANLEMSAGTPPDVRLKPQVSRHPHPDGPTALTRLQLLDAQTQLEAAPRDRNLNKKSTGPPHRQIVMWNQPGLVRWTFRETCLRLVPWLSRRHCDNKIRVALPFTLLEHPRRSHLGCMQTIFLLWNIVFEKMQSKVQDIRELGMGWAWFVNDLRVFLPAWQDM